MGFLGDLFGGGKNYRDDYQMYNKVLQGDNRKLQERQDVALGNENIARLMTPEGRAMHLETLAGRMDAQYRDAMVMGYGNLARQGMAGGSASSLLRERLMRARSEGLAQAETQAGIAAGGFSAQILSDMRKEHMNMTGMKLNYVAGAEGRKLASMQSKRSFMSNMQGFLFDSGTEIGKSFIGD